MCTLAAEKVCKILDCGQGGVESTAAFRGGGD